MKKRALSFMLAFTMVAAGLAGCSSSSGSSDTTAADTTAAGSEAADTTAAAEESTGEKTTLKWSVWDISATPYYQLLVDAFEEKHPDVTVEMVDLGSTDYQTVLATELTGSGSDFDVVSIKDVPGYTTLVNKGVLEPLDSYIESSGVDLTQYKGIADQVRVDGQLYELPYINSFWVLFYNKDIFDAAGVEYPTNDMTFEEYDALARSLTVTTPGQEVYGAHYHTWRSAVQLFGVLDGEHTILDGNYDFLKPYYEMVINEQNDGVCQDYATLKTSGLHYSGAFAQGNVAMMNQGTWFFSTLIEKIKTGEYTECTNWGIVKYPHAEGVEPGSTLSQITSLAIPTSSDNKDLAWEFIQFLSGEEGAEIVASTGAIPAIMSDSVVDLISSTEGFPQDENSIEALNTSNLYLEMPVHAKSSEIETALNEAHDSIMTGSCTIDEGIAQMNEQVSAILAE